jgi:serine/threonine protein kinase
LFGDHCIAKKSIKDNVKEYLKEINLMMDIKQKYIATCKGSGRDENGILYIFYEKYLPSKDALKSPVDPLQRIKYVYQLLCGFSYLEANKILHGDIKPDNTLYCKESDSLKIC